MPAVRFSFEEPASPRNAVPRFTAAVRAALDDVHKVVESEHNQQLQALHRIIADLRKQNDALALQLSDICQRHYQKSLSSLSEFGSPKASLQPVKRAFQALSSDSLSFCYTPTESDQVAHEKTSDIMFSEASVKSSDLETVLQTYSDDHPQPVISTDSAGTWDVLGNMNRAIIGWRILFQGLGLGMKTNIQVRAEYIDFAARGNRLHAQEYNSRAKKAMKSEHRRALSDKTLGGSIMTYGASPNIVIQPGSRMWMIWATIVAMLLVYDFATIPCKCIDASESTFSDFMMWVARCFWCIDMLVSCATCKVRADGNVTLYTSALKYARTWFVLDLAFVVLDWWILGITHGTTSYYVIVFMRLLRLQRLVRIYTWFLDGVIRLAPVVYFGFIKIVLACVAWIHIAGCAWYCVGDASGSAWASDSDVSFRRRYLFSLHVAFSQLLGASILQLDNVWERIYGLLSLSVGHTLFSVFVARVTHMTFHFSKREANIFPGWRQFKKKHSLRYSVEKRAEKQLALHSKRLKFKDRMQLTSEMLLALTPNLKADILEEIHRPRLVNIRFFWDVGLAEPKSVRQICHMMEEVLCVAREVVFCEGDECHAVIFIASGELDYECLQPDDNKRSSGSSSLIRPLKTASVITEIFGEIVGTQRIRHGRHLCEVCLWTEWVHRGDLITYSDSNLVQLTVGTFLDVCAGSDMVMEMAFVYAKSFVKALLDSDFRTDLFEFEEGMIGMDELYSEEDNYGDLSQSMSCGVRAWHYLFLSHYKEEAGTEATLMQEQLHGLVQNMLHHPARSMKVPIFLDVENLTDLSSLKVHVMQTMYLVLLLTPGILSRPWCLIEIVIALRSGLSIVPVEINRPGMTAFQYPNEDFYKALREGSLLDATAQRLLDSEDIGTNELEGALRKVFLQIALPFSPTKAQNIRQVELENILKRCPFDARTTISMSAPWGSWRGSMNNSMASPFGSSLGNMPPGSMSPGSLSANNALSKSLASARRSGRKSTTRSAGSSRVSRVSR